jgi:hypothetical protein
MITVPIKTSSTFHGPVMFSVQLWNCSSDAVIYNPQASTVVCLTSAAAPSPTSTVTVTTAADSPGSVAVNYEEGWSPQAAISLGGPYITYSDEAPPINMRTTNPVTVVRAAKGLPTGTVAVSASAPGLIVQDGTAGPVAVTDANGNAGLTVTSGQVNLQFRSFLTIATNSATGETTTYYVSVGYSVTAIAGTTIEVPVKVAITSWADQITQTCECNPWVGLVGGTVDGVQRVSAAGGSYGLCPGLEPLVTVTGPGGINVTLTSGWQAFSPAADGTWTVTSVICNNTNTATITLP